MIWLWFAISAVLIVAAATQLARYGDAIALRTRLGGMLVGSLLLAGATSLPELLTTLNSLGQGIPNLAAGDIFGSCMFNVLLLGVLDIIHYRSRILRRVAMRHALTAGLATLLLGMAIFFILADIQVQILWVGLDSLLILGMYIFGVWVIRSTSRMTQAPEATLPVDPRVPGLLQASIGFASSAAALVIVAPWLVSSAGEIAHVTGLGTGFVGAVFVAITTSLPEVVTVTAAARYGAYDLAVGNLFGSNVFNMFALSSTDFWYLPGRYLGRIDPAFALVGLLAMLLTNMGLIGNLARLERRLLFVEVDAMLLIIGYCAGLWLLYSLGIGA